MHKRRSSVLATIAEYLRFGRRRIGSSHGVMVLSYLIGLVLLIAMAVSLISLTDRGRSASGSDSTSATATEKSSQSDTSSPSSSTTTTTDSDSPTTSDGGSDGGSGAASSGTDRETKKSQRPNGDPPGMVHNTDVKYLGDNKYRVTWTYADDDGGLDITGHVVRDGPGDVLAKVGPDTYQAVVTGEDIDTVTVCAVNAAGEGPQAAAHP